jgi:signal transduction histidine kinase
VVLLEHGHGNVAAAAGTLTSLRGHATELMAPPSLFAQAVAERRLLIVNAATRDTRVDPRYGAAFGMRQVLVAPLLIGGEVAAVLCAVNSARGAFGESDGALAQRLADHGALALRNARLVRSAERAARHARLIADAGRALAQHVTPHSFFPALARLIEDALPANGFRILLADRGTRRIDHLFAGGVGRGLPAHDSEHLWEAVGGQVVLTGTPAFVGDIDVEPEVGPAALAYRVALRGVGARRAAILPLAVDGEVRGLLSLYYPEPRAFEREERALLLDLCAQIAVAVRNVSLLDALRRSHARAEGAAAVARAALAAPDVASGAAAILGALGPLVPCEGLVLSVADATHGALRCVGATGTLHVLRGTEIAGAPAAAPMSAAVPLERVRAPWVAAGAPPHDALLVPLVAHGRVIGDVCAVTAVDAPLPPGALETLRFLAPTAALALDVLLLDERGQRQHEDERRLAAQLRQAEKMAALGELVAGVAHEINNPLTGISAFAELLLLEDGLGPEQRESVRLIKREADRAVGVVRDLLAFSRKTEPEHLPLQLDALLEHVVRMRAYALRAGGIALTLDLAPGLPPVRGDEAKLQQVILNLLLNAEYALREAATPQLTVRARATTSGTAGVVIEVGDTGVGIPPDALARIFEPFYTTKPPGEGTGLGLSVSYGIVQSHGGEITVRSTPGAGTTFAVALPSEPPLPPMPAFPGSDRL